MAAVHGGVLQDQLIQIFEATAQIDRATSAPEIIRQLRKSIECHGYAACLVTELPRQDTGSLDGHILVNGWPQEWYDRYMAAGHYRHDPCVAVCRGAIGPFLWRDVHHGLTDRNARRVMDEAKEFGLCDGICIPIQPAFGEPACVTVAGNEIDLAPTVRCTIHALARHAYSAAERLVDNSRRRPRQKLSQREREILQWVAGGKTAWEVSRILGISENTVTTHLRNIKQKLSTANVVHAIVEAFRRHEIEL
ncbi:autoinducer binding domain-containing protein [Mesorhizobium sp. M0323]|uniref:autoinducer binding domain-containing protein n=1 Tax=Mesorhizobium sp. M0323 TaxID=2956938 RepID=UPI0033392D2A